MKKLLSLFMAVMATVGLYAQTEKSLAWTATTDWTLDTEAKTAVLTEDGFSIVAEIGANTTNNAPTVNAKAVDFRAYVGNVVTISAPEGTEFTKVVFTVSAQGKKRWSGETSVNVGALVNNVEAGTVTWEGDATNSIAITVGAKATLGTEGSEKAGQFDVASPIVLTLVAAGETPELPGLTINGTYADDYSSWTGTVEPLTAGNSLYYSVTADEDEPEFQLYEGPIVLAYTPEKVEFGACKFVLLVQEKDAEGNVVAQGVEKVSLVAPKPEVSVDVKYNEEGHSSCTVFAFPTTEGNMVVYNFSEDISEGAEGEVPATGLQLAWTPGMADASGVCKWTIYFFEVDADYNVIATGMEEVSLAKPYEPMAGDEALNPIILATGNNEPVAADKVGADEAGYTHFRYTAEKDGLFVFSCGYEIKAFDTENGMEAVETHLTRNAYGKKVTANEVITFSAYLPQSYEGVAYDEEGNEIEGETDLYPVNEYTFFADVEEEATVPSGIEFTEIPQDQGKQYDDFSRAEVVEGDGYTQYTVHGGLWIAFKMMDIDCTGQDYVLVKFAEPVEAGWQLAFWSNQDLVPVPAGATEFRFDLEDGMKESGKLPQVTMMTFFGEYPNLTAKVEGVYLVKETAGEEPNVPEVATLEVGTSYSEDYSSCTLVVTPTKEGTMLYWTDEENGEPMGLLNEEGGNVVAYTPGRGEEAGTQVWQIYVYEVEVDENGEPATVVAMGYEQVNLVAPKAKVELATAYSEDNSSCVITATGTQDGTSLLISIDGGEEFMELPAEGYTVAWLEALADNDGICIYNIVVKEVTYDADYTMTEVSSVEEQIHLSKPIVIEPAAGDSQENPIVLTDSWNEIPAAKVGKDEANVTYFSYTAEHAGQFVFSCNPGKIANCTLPELSEEQYMGMGTGYGKVVAKGETVTFSAILPAVFEGVAYDENGEEIEGETELYDVDTYYIAAEVTALPVVAPEKPAAPAFSELVADNETIYYLYNTEAGAFFMSANDWSTRASVDADFGFEFKIEANGEGKYILHDNVKARYGANGARDLGWKVVFAESATSIYVDRGNQPNWDNWTITPLGDGTYTIGNEAVAGLLGLKADQDVASDSRLYFVESGATTWAFVSEADYAKYWEDAADYVAYQKIEAAKEHIYAMASELNSTNVYTAEAMEAFQAKHPVSAWVEGADYNTLTAEEAEAAEAAYKANFSVTGWHAANDIDDLLTSAWEGADGNFGGKYYINTWSTEGENDGSDFKVPFFEYWTGDGESLGANTMTATMTGLIPGATYGVSALTRVRTKGVDKNNDPVLTDPNGISFQIGDSEAVNASNGEQVGASRMFIQNVLASGVADAEGNLTISFVVAQDNNISWLSWKNVYYWLESLPVIEVNEPEYNEGGTMATITTNYTPAEGNMLVAYVNYDYSEPYAMVEDGKVVVAPTEADFIGAAAHLIVTIREVKYDEATGEFVVVAEGQTEAYFAREIPAMAGDSDDDPIILATGWNEAIAKDACGADEAGYTHFKYVAEKAGTFVFSCGGETTFGDEDGMAAVENTEVRFGYGKKVAEGEEVTFSAYLPGAWYNEDTNEMVILDEYMFYANVIEDDVPFDDNILVNGDAETSYAAIACAWGKENQGEPHAADIETEEDGNKVFVVHATDKVTDPWDNQFWICAPKKFYKGDKIKVTFRYKATTAVKVPTQAHCEPSDYNHWDCIGTVNFTTEWQTYEKEVVVTKEIAGGEDENAKGFKSIAFNLNENIGANDYYFDDLTWEILEEGTGVAGVKANTVNDGAIYDLAGRKVSKVVKGGIYIVNGKKVVLK